MERLTKEERRAIIKFNRENGNLSLVNSLINVISNISFQKSP